MAEYLRIQNFGPIIDIEIDNTPASINICEIPFLVTCLL